MSNISKTSCLKRGHRDRSKGKGGDGDNRKEEKGGAGEEDERSNSRGEVFEGPSNDEMMERERWTE